MLFRSRSHPERGENVAAAIVLAEGARADAEGLRAALKEELSAYKVPRHWFFDGDGELPFTDSGKIDRKRLGALLSARIAAGDAGEAS